WNRIESLEIDPHKYSQFILDKDSKAIQWRKDENWITTYKRMKLDHYLTLHIKINSKWIKDLNVRPETMKLLEENIGSKLLDISLAMIFFYLTPKTKAIKAKL
ncbi:LORF2 protein, partial [Crocuta crocuta]